MIYISSVLVLLSTGLVCVLSASTRKIYYPLAAVVIIFASLVVGFRDTSLGQDTLYYLYLFRGSDLVLTGIEPGYKLLLSIFRLFTDMDSVFLITHALLTNSILFFVYDRLYPKSGVFLLGIFSCTHVYWLIHIQLLRNGLSSALFVGSIAYLVANKNRLSYATMIGAAMIHYSTFVVAYVVIVATRIKGLKPGKLLVVSAFFSLILYVVFKYLLALPFFEPWISRYDDYAHYNDTLFFQSTLNFSYIPLLIIIVLFMFLRKNLRSAEKYLFFIYLVITALSISFWSNVLYRDRIYISAQMLEPVLLFMMVKSINVRAPLLPLFTTYALLVAWAAGVVFFWGPRNVLS